MLKKMILKIMVLPLIMILTPVNLLGRLLLHCTVFVNGLVLLLLTASLIICIRNGDIRSSGMAVLFGTAGIAAVLAVGFINVFLEDAMGAMLKFMVS